MLKTIYRRMFNGVSLQNGVAYAQADWSNIPHDVEPEMEYRKFLGPRAMRVIRAVAEAMFDDGGDGLPAERLDWFEREINDYFASSGGASTFVLKLAPWILEVSPILTLSHLSLLTHLELPLRQKCLARVEHSAFPPLALIYLLCKALICLIYLEHPDALVETGFDGECMHGRRPDMPIATIFSV